MRVTISIGARFHAFDMAWQLQRRGCLRRLITSFPKFKVRQWNIERQRIDTVLSHEVMGRGWRLLGPRLGWRGNPHFALNDRFDRIAAGRLPGDSDLVVAWTGMALHTLRRARELGAVTVAERNSTHIGFQSRIMDEEYRRLGLPPGGWDPRTVERELEEYEEADYVCLPSTFARRSFIESGVDAGKLLMVPFGVSAEQFPVAGERNARTPFRIAFCGSLCLRKGLHYLLQAFHELRLPGAELWLIGPMAEEMRPFLAKYNAPGIRLRGALPQGRLHQEYGQCDLFCLPSIEDGFAMVIPQAMACGLPVICSENTAAYDLVREGAEGHVVPIRDVELLKERIAERYAGREATRAMGRQARRRIETAGTWDHYGAKLVEAYQEVLERRGAEARPQTVGSARP